MKKALSFILALTLCLALAVPAFAADSEEIEVVKNLDNLDLFFQESKGTTPCFRIISDDKSGLMDINGNIIVPPRYGWVGDACEGMMSVGISTNDDRNVNKYGFINTKGEEIVSPIYDKVKDFSEGMAAVCANGKWGFINAKGEMSVPLVYDGVESFSEGLAAVWTSTTETKDFYGLEMTEEHIKLGFVDKTGALVIPQEYAGFGFVVGPSDVQGFHEGLAAIRNSDNQFGAIDKTGKVVIPFSNGTLGTFYEGLATKASNGKTGVVDKTGKFVVKATYDVIEDYHDGYAIVANYDAKTGSYKYGAIDRSGKLVVPITYDAIIGGFSEGMCVVAKGERGHYSFGYVDTKGQLIVPLQYDFAAPFSCGLARVGLKASNSSEYHYGYVDKTGKVALPIVYSHANDFQPGGGALVFTGKGNAGGSYGSGFPEYIFMGGKPRQMVSFSSCRYIDVNGNDLLPQSEKYAYLLSYKRYSETSGQWSDYKLDNNLPNIIVQQNGWRYYALIKNPLYGKEIATAPTTSNTSNTATALPTSSNVLVNGKQIAFDAYNIGGNNYFKLRDVAQALRGTGKQFEVTWNEQAKAINLVSNKPYTSVGGELAKGDGASKTAIPNSAPIYKDGKAVTLSAYNIGGNNYFKLRDLGQAFNFDISWDGQRNTISIDTSKGYTAN